MEFAIGKYPVLIYNGCVEPKDDGDFDSYHLDLGEHSCAVEVHTDDEARKDLVMSSVNAMIIAANELNCDPLVLAASLQDNIAEIAQALVCAREGLQMVRDIVEDNGHEFPDHTWDVEDGVPGHALHLICNAINYFPVEIEFTPPEEAHKNLIRKMRDGLVKLQETPDGRSILETMGMDSIIKRAGEILGD